MLALTQQVIHPRYTLSAFRICSKLIHNSSVVTARRWLHSSFVSRSDGIRTPQTKTLPLITPLTGNELYCLALKGYRAGEVVTGNSVYSFGVGGALRSLGADMVGGENTACTQLIAKGRMNAQQRLVEEASAQGACGVTGVSTQIIHHAGNIEFLAIGSCVHRDESLKQAAQTWTTSRDTSNAGSVSMSQALVQQQQGSNNQQRQQRQQQQQPLKQLDWISSCSGEELFCVLDMGFSPISIIFGNAAYSRGVGGVLMSSLRNLVRGEVKEMSDVFTATRHLCVERLQAEAVANGANAVLGVRTKSTDFGFTEEMNMLGTGCHHPELPAEYTSSPLTSALTDEETWNVMKMGYTPVSIVLGVSVYSLGIAGSIRAFFQDVMGGEVTALSSILYEARQVSLDKVRAEARKLHADEVVGCKLTVNELGGGLYEFVTIGTAVKAARHIKSFQSASLPVQALVRDRSTFSEKQLRMEASTSSGASGGFINSAFRAWMKH